MARSLNEIERRVLGALIEKALAQPQYYPMTLNALVAACNQKSNRDPLMDLDDNAVWDTLERLRAAGLVSRLLPGGASRVERYKHEVKEQLGWEKPQRAVMAELLLRGPQTLGELRTHCGRMYAFESPEALSAVVEGLAHTDPPWLSTLPRAPGQSATRYAHQLYTPQEWHRLAEAAGPAAAPAAVGPASTGVVSAEAASDPPPRSVQPAEAAGRDLPGCIAAFETQLTRLQAEVADLRRRLEAAGL